MKKSWLFLCLMVIGSATFGTLFFTGCGKDLSTQNPLLPSNPVTIPCAPPKGLGGIFWGFEANSFSPWGGSDIWTNTSKLSYATRTSIAPYDECFSWWLQLTISPDATWGPWVGITGAEGGDADFGTPANFIMAYKLDKATSFTLMWDEGSDSSKNADGEEWHFDVKSCDQASPPCLNPNGSWNTLTIPLTSFKENSGSESTGNNTRDTHSITQVWFNWSSNPMRPVASANFYIDDIRFE